jgi:lipopolysaccharide/colanic/teichoic acid biosynthesis glycosyltransferase
MYTNQSVLTFPLPDVRYRMHFRNAAVRRLYGVEAECYLARFVDVGSQSTEIFSTSTIFNIAAINGKAVHSIINLKRMNDIEEVNKFLEIVNRKLPYGGLYVGCVETIDQRRNRILKKLAKPVSYIYYLFDFILKRVFPKWEPTRKIYSLLTRGNNRAISLTETLGRLKVCGFDIIDYTAINGLTYFVVQKIARSILNREPFYGLIIRLPRIGKGGELFYVYKFRTMHPYAEFIQEYVYEKNKLAAGGKFANDFRITGWGRWMRKLWLDEFPMIINWLRGEMKLVGVRPITRQYFTLYPEEFRNRRIQYPPGLIPPYYVDLPKTIEEIIESERRYLDTYDKHPWITDARYMVIAMYNILIKRKRSV